METRANHVFVGAVTMLLLGVLAAFIVWLVRLNEGAQNQFDIFFRQSVTGLANGSGVTFSGVPVGKVDDIELWRKDPGFVRVRISVDENVPVLLGTIATFQAGLTGGGNILLEGATRGAPKLACPEEHPEGACPEGVPVIPTKNSGLGAIISSAPVLLERLGTLAERLNTLLDDDNQAAFKGILKNTDRLTGNLADASPQVKVALADLQGTLRQATQTLATFDQAGASANKLLGDGNGTLVHDLRGTLQSAQKAVDELKSTLGEARPAIRQLSDTTMPEASAALRDLRETSQALRALTEKIDDQGVGGLTAGGGKLPDYKP